jgi:hypothetical protein
MNKRGLIWKSVCDDEALMRVRKLTNCNSGNCAKADRAVRQFVELSAHLSGRFPIQFESYQYQLFPRCSFSWELALPAEDYPRKKLSHTF